MRLSEALKKYGYAGVITLLFLGTLIVQGDVYECPGNEPPIRECIKLSESGRSCYHELGRDLCSDGEWELVMHKINAQHTNIELCTPSGCEPLDPK